MCVMNFHRTHFFTTFLNLSFLYLFSKEHPFPSSPQSQPTKYCPQHSTCQFLDPSATLREQHSHLCRSLPQELCDCNTPSWHVSIGLQKGSATGMQCNLNYIISIFQLALVAPPCLHWLCPNGLHFRTGWKLSMDKYYCQVADSYKTAICIY